RFVCMSDTHNLHDRVDVPPGDVFIHAGDFTMTGLPAEVENFNEFLGRLPHKEKIVIAGNHELTFDAESYPSRTWDRFGHPEAYDCEAVRRSLTNCTYLEDSEVTVRGYRIYGSPWQVVAPVPVPRQSPGRVRQKWSIIPPGVDILVTHGPPLGHGDQLTRSRQRTAGCVDLLRAVQTIRPLYHIFGHMHEGYGMTEDGIGTIYVNARYALSQCNRAQQFGEPRLFSTPKLTDLYRKTGMAT
ncbi:Metallo-dependent phosphatase-like protein, partial [Baffinella frigidus]